MSAPPPGPRASWALAIAGLALAASAWPQTRCARATGRAPRGGASAAVLEPMPALPGADAARDTSTVDPRPAQLLALGRPRPPGSPASSPSSASAWRLVATALDGRLVDVDIATGALDNPRPLSLGRPPAGLTTLTSGVHVVSIAYIGRPGIASVYTVDIDTGMAVPLGPSGVDTLIEGDIDVEPATGYLYGMYGHTTLLRFDPLTGAATPVGDISSSALPDPSAMAFDSTGQLWVYGHDSSFGTPDRLCRVDPIAVAVLDCVDLVPEVRAVVAGMDFHPVTGELYLVTGRPDATVPRVPQGFYRVDPATGSTYRIAVVDPVDLSGLEFVAAIP